MKMNTAQMPSLPERDLARIPELVEEMFRKGVPSEAPFFAVKSNLLETWQSFWLQIAVPGVDIGTLQVQAAGRRVHLAARYNPHVIETATYLRQELPMGELNETFELPEEVEGQRAEAHYDGGILTIRLPKLSYLAPASIPVHCP
jgi:HSP20 family protein